MEFKMSSFGKFLKSKAGKALLGGLLFTAGGVARAADVPVVADAASWLAALLGLAG